ncbi:hypothetical protein KM043_010568 [Ampulex compressa]|nr:hypothetical protein KM043_010568 [Ampulex compressa]
MFVNIRIRSSSPVDRSSSYMFVRDRLACTTFSRKRALIYLGISARHCLSLNDLHPGECRYYTGEKRRVLYVEYVKNGHIICIRPQNLSGLI